LIYRITINKVGNKSKLFFLRNPDSEAEAIRVPNIYLYTDASLRAALFATGFGELPYKVNSNARSFQPCPLGTFSNSSSRGKEGCIKCSAGIRPVFRLPEYKMD